MCRIAWNHLVATLDLPGTLCLSQRMLPRRVAAPVLLRPRDHFTEAEVQGLLSLTRLPMRDQVVLGILAETGLRRRAVAWLTVAAVFVNDDNNKVQPILYAT